jgi:putative transposase
MRSKASTLNCAKSSRPGHFPTDEAATKLLWLALRNITANWPNAVFHWRAAMTQFAGLYGSRFTGELQ